MNIVDKYTKINQILSKNIQKNLGNFLRKFLKSIENYKNFYLKLVQKLIENLKNKILKPMFN